jgi:hypothetical protein
VRFLDFLRVAVLLFAGAANALAVITVIGAQAGDDLLLLYVGFAWWLAAAVIGLFLGRRLMVFRGIGRLLAGARSSPALPEQEPGAVLLNRLWTLAVFTLAAGGVGVVLPQISAIAVGFPLMAALALRKQALAVQAIEERDGVRFYIDRTSALKPTRLLRTPGFKKWVDETRGGRDREPVGP